MTGSAFGEFFRVSTFGESHGEAMGVVIDGCPAGFELDCDRIRTDLERRRPGTSKYVTPRAEGDSFELLSGLFKGKTTGAPLAFSVKNSNVRSKDYSALENCFRPGHADFSYYAKYRHRDHRGGGRASARETLGRVIAGSVAVQLLELRGLRIYSGVSQIGSVCASRFDWDYALEHPFGCLDPNCSSAMEAEVLEAKSDGDSVGGVVELRADGLPAGLGEPVFGKLDAAIAAALMSIPAAKGVEIGDGFSLASMRGSCANDEMLESGFASNRHGGILGGISTSAPIVARVAFKPTPSIRAQQRTIDTALCSCELSTEGRHDPCVVPRARIVVESMLALVLVDYWAQLLAQRALRSQYSPVPELCCGGTKS